MAQLRVAGSRRPRGIAVRVRKAPWRGVEDSPLWAFAIVIVAARSQPSSSKAPPPQGALRAGFSSSSCSRVASEEELAMIESRVFPPSCKDLASA